MVESKFKIPIWAYVMLAILAIIIVIGLIYGINHFTTVEKETKETKTCFKPTFFPRCPY